MFVRLLTAACLLACAACASTPQDRGPWHQYLHDKGLE
jgi:hypothetical protein